MRIDQSFARFATALCITFLAMPSAFAQAVFINEIHYDNSGSDSGEAIEIAGPAGTDLTGWSIALYNGSSTQRNVYGTINLSGVIPNQDNGYGTLSFARSGIQNGGPDGMALIDAGSVMIQFLSYEGSFVAASGPATGLTSTDIGMMESSSSLVGNSLQLIGSGTTYTDFAWTGSAPDSFGCPNTGQAFAGGGSRPPCPIFINEVDADQASTDDAEFVELYDGGIGNSDLTGLVLVLVNGSDDLSYNAFDLDGQSTNGSGYFVVCGDAATTANCDLDVSPDTNLIQNGADAVALLVGDASDYPTDTPVEMTRLIDAIVYDTSDSDDAGLLPLLNAGQPQVNENGSGNKDFHSNQRCPNGSGGARNTDTYKQFAPTPGAVNICVAPAREAKIHEVQGSGADSPEAGNQIIIEGIVVGDFQDGASGTHGDLNGFHVQEEDADADADPMTSEGIFVYNGSSPSVDVQVGDLVRVEGAVSEFRGMTEITSFTGVTVLSSGNPIPTASILSLPVTDVNDFEAYEGMYVTFAQPLVISEYFNFGRYNEIVLTSERNLTPTAEFEPGPDANAAADAFLLDRITLDDGRTSQNSDPALHPNGGVFDLTNLFRGGDTVTNVTGVIDYSNGLYRIHPTQGADYANDNPRAIAPEDVGGSLTVASSNVLNYFTTLDYSSGHPLDNTCGPSQNMGCRGADDADEFDRQRAKIVAALAGMDADIVGLVEIENNVTDDAVIDLVSGLNDASAPGTYDYVSTGTIGTDAIKVALIYKPASVSLEGGYAILDSSVDARFLDDRNRPVLAQTFIDNTTGGVFTVAVNHLKSKGSSCSSIGDPNTGDGSGNCNVTRTDAAAALVDWLAGDPTGSGDDDFIILGDLNSYDKEEPIDAILAGGYTDLLNAFKGEDAYSYVFGGQTGYLDYALSSGNLTPQVTGTTAWHINADEPGLIDYDTRFKQDAQDAIYAPDAYRSSDHDPVLVGLETCDEIPPTIDAIYLTHDVLWPANHNYVDIDVNIFASDNFDTDIDVSLLSVTSNEPDNGDDDGNTVDDIETVNDQLIKLRAERSGEGSGRIYTMTYQATDDCGNTATAEATVTVPLNKGKK